MIDLKFTYFVDDVVVFYFEPLWGFLLHLLHLLHRKAVQSKDGIIMDELVS